MQKSFVPFFILPLLLAACFLGRKEYKTTEFTYSRNGQAFSIPLVVPNGFSRHEKADTAGISIQTFYYPNGALLYAAYLQDTQMRIQPFDARMHLPKVHTRGGLVFKGQDENELFYREIRQGNLRFGYRQVPGSAELLFDSATNFASLQKNSLR